MKEPWNNGGLLTGYSAIRFIEDRVDVTFAYNCSTCVHRSTTPNTCARFPQVIKTDDTYHCGEYKVRSGAYQKAFKVEVEKKHKADLLVYGAMRQAWIQKGKLP